jgi:hypothetical protein
VKDRLEANYPGILVTRYEIEQAWKEYGDGNIGIEVRILPLIITSQGRSDCESINAITTGVDISADLAGIVQSVANLDETNVIEELDSMITRLAALRNVLTVQGYQDTRDDQ